MTEEIKEEIEEEPQIDEVPEEQPEEEPEVKPEGEPEKKPEEDLEKPARFELKGDFPEDPEPKPEETHEIVHLGQVYNVTTDKYKELAQKGFDYDSKVGPHGKLVQMIESDPELANVVNEAWQRKVAGLPITPTPEKPKAEDFKVKPITDYQNESEWLQDNLTAVINTLQDTLQPVPAPAPVFQPAQPEQPAPAPEAPKKNTVKEALQMRDSESFHTIYPKLGDYVQQLSVADYRRIDSDMGALCQFYDFVKESELNKSNPATTVKQPGFKVRSGGGEPPRSEDVPPAWKLTKAEFQKQLDKIKGY